MYARKERKHIVAVRFHSGRCGLKNIHLSVNLRSADVGDQAGGGAGPVLVAVFHQPVNLRAGHGVKDPLLPLRLRGLESLLGQGLRGSGKAHEHGGDLRSRSGFPGGHRTVVHAVYYAVHGHPAHGLISVV